MLDPATRSKEALTLLWDLEELLPQLLQITGRLETAEAHAMQSRLETLLARVRVLREATDCLPAAEAGRRTSAPGGAAGRATGA